MSKLFKVAGLSKLNGKLSVRYANAASRAKVLARNGHEDVNLYVFPEAMAKEDLIDELLNESYRWNKAEKAAIVAEARKLGFLV